jgi:phage shock protein A
MSDKQTRKSLNSSAASTPDANVTKQKKGGKQTISNQLADEFSQLKEEISNLKGIVEAQAKQIDIQNDEILKLNKFVDAQANHIVTIEENYSCLLQRVRKNEHQTEINASVSIVKDRVISELQDQINRNEQFMRRPCISIAGLRKEPRESYDDLKKKVESLLAKTNGDVTIADVDKFHRDGPLFGNKQDIIVRFLSHTAKEVFYDHRKNIAGGNKFLKVRPNLTEGTRQLLKETNDAIKDYAGLSNPPQFVCPDVHGNLMVMLKFKSRLGLFVKFRNMESFRSKIELAQHTDKDDDEFNKWYDFYDVEDDDDDDDGGNGQ